MFTIKKSFDGKHANLFKKLLADSRPIIKFSIKFDNKFKNNTINNNKVDKTKKPVFDT
jgi:hypothetical protein